MILALSVLQPFMSPRYPGGPRPSLRMPNQPPGSIPGSQPLLPNSLDPTRPQGNITKMLRYGRGATLELKSVNKLKRFVSCHRSSKHGRTNEDESSQRHGRHGSTGRHQRSQTLTQMTHSHSQMTHRFSALTVSLS